MFSGARERVPWERMGLIGNNSIAGVDAQQHSQNANSLTLS